MTLTEGFIMYGDDQAYIDHPSHSTVGFQLIATDGLCQIADRIRVEAGFRPMCPMDEYDDAACDNEGWYDFYAGLNGFSDTRMDNSIDFVVVNSDSPDNEKSYSIDLSLDEQHALSDRLNELCKNCLGQNCEELLEEARKTMEEDSE